MRDFKFRAWDDKNKKWLLGYEYPNLGGFSLTGETVLLGEWGNTFDGFLFEKKGLKWNDLKIMQYTGLKDKNGKEIYEEDIVEYDFNFDPEIDSINEYDPKIYVVKWTNDCYSGKWGWDLVDVNGDVREYYYGGFDVTKCVLIGNIYENPELLK